MTSGAYTSDGRRRSSMVHATRAHQCELCDATPCGNGGKVAHGRGHVRRGEAVEVMLDYGPPAGASRVFLAPDDPALARLLARGYEVQR